MHTYDITTKAGRRKLEPRMVSPYYLKLGDASIGFRCTAPGGEGTWMGRKFENGKYVYQALGRFDDYRDAVEALHKWLAEHEQRRIGGVGKEARDITVADVCRLYLDDFRKRKGDGLQYRYARNILDARVTGREAGKWKAAVEPAPIAGIRLIDLTRLDFKNWKESLLPCSEANAERKQRATANRHFKALVAVLNFAKECGFVTTDAAWKGVSPFGNSDADATESHRYLTPTERRRLIDACIDPAVRPFIELMACIGARPVELTRATVGDFNPRTNELTLWSMKGHTGNRRLRKVPLASLPGALPVVVQQVKDKLPAAPLFDVRGSNDYLGPVRKAVADALLPDDVTAYSLRHSFITDALVAGVPIHHVASITGTSIVQIDSTYGKTVEAHARESFGRLATIPTSKN